MTFTVSSSYRRKGELLEKEKGNLAKLLDERIESIINIRCCFECSERFLGCHSKCNKYIAEKENNEKVQAERHKQTEVNYSIYQIKQQNIIRSGKKLRQV